MAERDSIIIRAEEIRIIPDQTDKSGVRVEALSSGRIYHPRIIGDIRVCLAEAAFLLSNPVYKGWDVKFGDQEVDKVRSGELGRVVFYETPRPVLWVSEYETREERLRGHYG